MTTVDESSGSAAPSTASADTSRTRADWLRRLESWIERLGDRLNPILVKEARQAMKSRQFLITFSLMLICGWGWSLIGLALNMPSVYYTPSGMFMLVGYYNILLVPLLLVVPFSAYRSLASEREDRTYELLSISTLTARQIVTGKLGSAVLQMLVYYSALAPCIACTYLLRGVDIISVLLLLFYTFCISLILCTAGLVLAGLARSRQWQSPVAVLVLLGLAGAGWSWGVFFATIVEQGVEQIPLDDPQFWIIQLAVFTAYVTYLLLLIMVAAAQNSFVSDNRSTAIRIVMVLQLVLFTGWISYGWLVTGFTGMANAAIVIAVIHWHVYGALLSSDSGKLSPRVRRQLPASFLGRVFLTWFNPGSGTGYILAVSNIAVLTLLSLVATVIHGAAGFSAASFSPMTMPFPMSFALLLFCYSVAYLGFGRLLILMIPHRERYGLVLPTLIHLLIVLVGAVTPLFLTAWLGGFRRIAYSPWQSTNWAWTLAESLQGRAVGPLVIVLVGGAALLIFVVNLSLTVREVEAVRQPVPQRVREEERCSSDPAVTRG